jgi:hypothetical protein
MRAISKGIGRRGTTFFDNVVEAEAIPLRLNIDENYYCMIKHGNKDQAVLAKNTKQPIRGIEALE